MRILSVFICIGAYMLSTLAADASVASPPRSEPSDSVSPNICQDGKYIFVPDTLADDVIRLLEGHSKVVDDQNHLDLDEKTIHRGDTIPMVIKNSWVGRFNRGLSNFLFIPKGTWQLGVTASYGELGTNSLEIFDLLSDVDISAHAFSIKPYVSYFINNNTAVGLKFGYYDARGDVNSFNLNIDDDMNFNLHDIMYRSESYSASVILTQYIGLVRRGRFGVFNEVDLTFQSGNTDFQRPYNGELRTTHTTSMQAQLNFSPGVQVMVMNNVAFHISFGVFGFYLKNEKQSENDVSLGNRFTSGANFRFNLFNINFGIAVLL